MGWRRLWQKLPNTAIVLLAISIAALAALLPIGILRVRDDHLQRLEAACSVLAFSIGAIGAAITLIRYVATSQQITRRRLDVAAERLTVQIRDQTSRQLTRLIGTDRATTTIADVRYLRAGGTAFLNEPETGREGTLDGVGRYYLEHAQEHRLVVLGDAGTGKTVLALELLTQLLTQPLVQVPEAPGDETRRPAAVPMRFNCSRWGCGTPLRSWLAREIVVGFGLPANTAKALVEQFRILPILDGLDELDRQDGDTDRIADAIGQINDYLVGRAGAPLVVTCRTDVYRRINQIATVAIRPATEIEIQPLSPEQIRDYLDREYYPPVGPYRRQQWDDILARLDDPNDPRPLMALRTPWRLTLAVACHRDGGDLAGFLPFPDESVPRDGTVSVTDDPYLRRMTTMLISAFIPARARLYRTDRYAPDNAVRWLRAIAEHLDTRFDIVLHEWWPAVGTGRVRRMHAWLVAALTIALVLASEALSAMFRDEYQNAVRLLHADFSQFRPQDYANAGWSVLADLAAPFFAVWLARRARVRPARAGLRQLRTVAGRQRFSRWLMAGAAAGMVPGLAFLMTYSSVMDGVSMLGLFFLTGASTFGIAGGLKPIGDTAIGPGDPLRSDLSTWLVIAGAVAIGFGVPAGLTFDVMPGVAARLAAMVAFGLIFGLVLPLALGLAGHAWLRYVVATAIGRHRRQYPGRFGEFLQWSYQAGILRISGEAYQFRHAELRDWLQGRSAVPTRNQRREVQPSNEARQASNCPAR